FLDHAGSCHWQIAFSVCSLNCWKVSAHDLALWAPLLLLTEVEAHLLSPESAAAERQRCAPSIAIPVPLFRKPCEY
ncbi:MAG: hypothetical protein M5U12_17225, partial [Verrucomicrobia bacterium]|nr:hypothetical protein [Verrucomicrobiota bacterium]